MNLFVEAKNLTKIFGTVTVVDNVSLNVTQGEVLGFLGPNGAGKTTTMRMIAGYLPPDAGSVTIQGIDMWQNPIIAKRYIGYLPEGAPLYSEMTPLQLLHFAGKMRGIEKKHLQERISYVIESLNLFSVLSQPIDTLSKGFKRRVGIATALLHDPDVLILDEPTDGLDPLQKQEMRQLIQHMAAQKAILISTHILEEVDAVCTRSAIIAQGKMLFDGTPQELRTSHKQEDINRIFCDIINANNVRAA
jgi:ABC-2 type transport system ATP-binding protein